MKLFSGFKRQSQFDLTRAVFMQQVRIRQLQQMQQAFTQQLQALAQQMQQAPPGAKQAAMKAFRNKQAGRQRAMQNLMKETVTLRKLMMKQQMQGMRF